jgi:hypothetical protein
VTIRRSRLAALAAAAAVLMQLCWPFVGQLRAAEPQMVQVVCTVHGVMTVPADEAPDAATAKPACALCSAAAVALPETLAAPALSDSAFFAALRCERGATPPSLHHSPSRPRAPPASA